MNDTRYGAGGLRAPGRWRSIAASTTLLAGLAACASIPNPTGEMATARAAVDGARRAGAGQLAPVELNDAQNNLTAAERAYGAKEYLMARRSAELARSSAELADEKTRLAKAAQSKSELDQTLKVLRNELSQPATVQPVAPSTLQPANR